VKELIKTVWRREDRIQISPKSEKMAVLVPTKLKNKAVKCTVMEPETVSKTKQCTTESSVKSTSAEKSTGRRKQFRGERAEHYS
jgi:predicted metal-dependent hydrolase